MFDGVVYFHGNAVVTAPYGHSLVGRCCKQLIFIVHHWHIKEFTGETQAPKFTL